MIFDVILFKKKEYTVFEIFFVSFFYTSLAIFLSFISFREYSSIFSVFLVTLALIPFFISRIKVDESFDMKIDSSKKIYLVHSKTLLLFFLMFIGITIAYMTWYILIDFQMKPVLFEAQSHIVSRMNGGFTGSFDNKAQVFMTILSNNLKVLAFVALFGLFYGFGGFFILAWNSSVLGYALGDYFQKFMTQGFGVALMKSFLRYFTHGVLEIMAYFVASIATGIIFIGILRKDFRKKNFDILMRDVTELFIISIIILIVAAFIEVYITPIFYM